MFFFLQKQRRTFDYMYIKLKYFTDGQHQI